ncbi:MAG: DUF3798 domain-containing protein [Christensenella sp.]
MIVTATYPDNFSTETETVISNAVAMASDPKVKAIVWCQSIPGTAAAIDKVRETRPEMIFISGTSGEAPGIIDPKADIVMQVDEAGCGAVMPPQAAKQSAKTFIHYSFPRHMSYALIVARHENLKKYCAENGIEFVDVTAPDPTGDAGVTGAQQFILEDVPRQIEKYGKDTVFFTTNCSMQEPLIRSVFENKAIYTLQCCPSPFHAFPSALNIDMDGHKADSKYMLEQLQLKVDEAGMNGRVSTWALPCNMLFVEAGVEYAKKVLSGETNGLVLDDAILRQTIQDCAGDRCKGLFWAFTHQFLLYYAKRRVGKSSVFLLSDKKLDFVIFLLNPRRFPDTLFCIIIEKIKNTYIGGKKNDNQQNGKRN